jgi:putative tricarboxylic transport membrane protein
VASGDVRVLAISAPQRTDSLPEVPTLTELGYPVVIGNWRGVFAAPGTSAERIGMFGELVSRAVQSESWQQSLQRYGWRSQVLRGEEFSEYLAGQERQLETIMNELGFIQ